MCAYQYSTICDTLNPNTFWFWIGFLHFSPLMILLKSGGKIDDKPARLDINIENVSLASELESTVTAFFYLTFFFLFYRNLNLTESYENFVWV